jgi:hypothetical protein
VWSNQKKLPPTGHLPLLFRVRWVFRRRLLSGPERSLRHPVAVHRTPKATIALRTSAISSGLPGVSGRRAIPASTPLEP